jgi:hypothetical protein
MPTLRERVENVGNLIKALIAFLGLLPGIAILTGLISIPPSLADLVKMLSVFICIVALVLVLLATNWILRTSGAIVGGLAVVAVIAGAGCASAYWSFANRHIVLIERAPGQIERYVAPLQPSAEIQALMAPYHGDYVEALETSSRSARLGQLMDDESGSAIGVMIALLLMSQVLMVGGVVAAAWKLALGDDASLNPQPLPPQQAPAAQNTP